MKTFNMATGTVEFPTHKEQPYLFKVIKQGVTFVVHERQGNTVVSEWFTGHHVFTLHGTDPHETIGLDIVVEAEIEKSLALHSAEKFNRYIAQRKEINS